MKYPSMIVAAWALALALAAVGVAPPGAPAAAPVAQATAWPAQQPRVWVQLRDEDPGSVDVPPPPAPAPPPPPATVAAAARTAPTAAAPPAAATTGGAKAGIAAQVVPAARYGPAALYTMAVAVSGSDAWAGWVARVAMCESGGNAAILGRAGERGLMQIHPTNRAYVERLGYSWESMLTPEANLAVAWAMYQQSGPRPWSCV